MAVPYLRTQVGPDPHRWTTFGERTTVLVIARTFTSTVKALEALAAFRGDPRVLVIVTVDDTSAFNAGTEALLRAADMCLLPWEEATALPVDLVLTASENVDLSPFTAPVAVLPHGIGFQKYVPDSESGAVRLAGVVREEFTEWSNVHMVISHPAQREQLRSAHPALAERAAVVGDPTHDRLRAARRLRHHYRQRFGLGPEQRLVVLTSTWGEESLIGTQPTLPATLLRELPRDRYRVAAVLHPNVWYSDSPWTVRAVLADAVDAGLALVPPDEGWGAALVAADCVIGDHGSVTVYGAALDRPVLLGAFGDEAVGGTAVDRLAHHAPRLGSGDGIRERVEAALSQHRPGRYTSVADLAFTHVDRAGRRLTEFLYRLLELSPPSRNGATRVLPPASPEYTPPASFEVRTRCTAPGVVHVERFPAAVAGPGSVAPAEVRHLAAEETEPVDAIVRSASVITGPCHQDPGSARQWAAAALDRYPGCLIAATRSGSGHHLAVRDRGHLRVRTDGTPDAGLPAALVYALLLHGQQRPAGPHTLHAGGDTWRCSIEPDS
ncbi:hypothetical protein FHX37_2557 [Haloactinospora alba]|uniref:CDP-glycerol:poly(Glycerophosphate) glycerophosphotransferase n=1 Tax=Haloactinospora alba TaxID=405555 RepID=A0A543NL76_9ACTN|nr:hypothetical protein [Haloactinospora alba]TQN32581.1 hypothetical protein FHX37_2557 [Haloactinospora alba]